MSGCSGDTTPTTPATEVPMIGTEGLTDLASMAEALLAPDDPHKVAELFHHLSKCGDRLWSALDLLAAFALLKDREFKTHLRTPDPRPKYAGAEQMLLQRYPGLVPGDAAKAAELWLEVIGQIPAKEQEFWSAAMRALYLSGR